VTFTIERPTADETHSPQLPHFADFLTFLDANPGLWAVYHRYPTSNPARQKAKRCRATHGPHGYEFAVRTTPEGHTLYGRRVARPHTE